MQVKAHTVYWFCFNTLDRETVVEVMRRSRSSRRCKTLEEMFIILQKPETVLQKQSPSAHHQIINEVSIQIQYRGSRIHGRGWECVRDTRLHYVLLQLQHQLLFKKYSSVHSPETEEKAKEGMEKENGHNRLMNLREECMALKEKQI